MAEWFVALLSVGAGTGVATVMRAWLVAKVTIWSLSADAEGRKHALAVLRLLKPHLPGQRDPDPPVKPNKIKIPIGRKDPPLVGSAVVNDGEL